MSDNAPILWWVRRDLRLSDNPALTAAAASGRPVIPVFLLDEVAETHGACPKWRLGLGAEALAAALAAQGSRLIFRRGPALATLSALVAETGAAAVHWSRAYDPHAVRRDTEVKAGLKALGIAAESHVGHVLFEPWTVATGQGGPYRVYTPFWRAVKDREVPAPLPAPGVLAAPQAWPASDDPADWRLDRAMDRGAVVVRPHLAIGEAAAQTRLASFVADRIADYATARDLVARNGTSLLSENLTYGEISPRQCWHAGLRALHEGRAGAEVFLKELVWREFSYHLAFHTPHIVEDNWRREWDAFPWKTDPDRPDVRAWQRGRTGIEFVDAAMREMYVTGRMHNRARMIVASYLTKHLMTHWKIGLDWFADCLADWDPAANAMGWQWSAGSGPDATPYFRVFNPVSQLQKFDPTRAYVDRWIAEGRRDPSPEALSYYDAIPRSWGLSPRDAYPGPVVTPEAGRQRALEAYGQRGF
ncbi:cryptochrome/photolyase family protein [Palleronia sp. KMU-117]|uniref:cryptochrome/photolyase family protein n=1 Tax=Palleronia sp. KMU-117 TaxID=3434108 RepID=UPI003D70DE6D